MTTITHEDLVEAVEALVAYVDCLEQRLSYLEAKEYAEEQNASASCVDYLDDIPYEDSTNAF